MRKARLGPSRRKKTGPHESSTSRRTITRGSGKENLVEPDLRYVDLNELHLTLEEAEKQFRDPAAKTQRFKVEKSRRYGRRTARPDPGEQESPPQHDQVQELAIDEVVTCDRDPKAAEDSDEDHYVPALEARRTPTP